MMTAALAATRLDLLVSAFLSSVFADSDLGSARIADRAASFCSMDSVLALAYCSVELLH